MTEKGKGVIAGTQRFARAFAIAAALGISCAASAAAGPTAAQKCEGGKNDAVGKYAACMAKAEKGFVYGGDFDAYDAAAMKCADKYSGTWGKLEDAGSCPTTGDATPIREFMDGCTASVAAALGGDPLPTDVVTCNTELATCMSDCSAAVRPPLSTGQETSYGAGTDGDLENGAVRSFTDNGDGTITDNVSGLMWEKKSDDGSIHDWDNLYTWSTAALSMDGTIVTAFLATLNGGGGFAGHTDWRIPNFNELETLRNLEAATPVTYSAFNTSCSPGCTVTTCSCTPSEDYWSSTTYQGDPSLAFTLVFVNGGTIASLKANAHCVRAVRAGS